MRDPFIILAIVPYAQVWDHDGKLLASELAQAFWFLRRNKKFFNFPFVKFRSVLRVDEVWGFFFLLWRERERASKNPDQAKQQLEFHARKRDCRNFFYYVSIHAFGVEFCFRKKNQFPPAASRKEGRKEGGQSKRGKKSPATNKQTNEIEEYLERRGN